MTKLYWDPTAGGYRYAGVPAAATAASGVTVADAGAHWTGSDVETVLSEVAGAFLPSADVVAPKIVTPPAALFAASALTTWYTANAVTAMRFHLPRSQTFRYINLYVGVSSGNIQVGTGDVTRLTTNVYLERRMNSGVIACPAASTAHQIDCGSTLLPAGDHVLFLWCDNTTATFNHGLTAGITGSRITFSQTGFTTGVPSTPLTGLIATTRWVSGLSLETAP